MYVTRVLPAGQEATTEEAGQRKHAYTPRVSKRQSDPAPLSSLVHCARCLSACRALSLALMLSLQLLLPSHCALVAAAVYCVLTQDHELGIHLTAIGINFGIVLSSVLDIVLFATALKGGH